MRKYSWKRVSRVNMSHQIDGTPMADDDDLKKLEERMLEIERDAKKLRDMQNEMSVTTASSTGSTESSTTHYNTPEEQTEIDSRSVYVGNVDYYSRPEELEEHFHSCGSVERVTILYDKFTGHPKGFAYIEFIDKEGMQNALALNESIFRERQIKVSAKRTNLPGISTTNRMPRGRVQGGMIVKYGTRGASRGGRWMGGPRGGFM
ncbi:hypothetical protein QR680_008589 [Steinernema hermaphroditum]|uniref:RRM domain-containing protein n=1 Tax=Steinernema hermaphroditum TaxID=289476 RepID=A0AA39M8B3_9BILA|nr:hypothetical protein QR680_008589 [Steinernema hermaphroditum]